MKRIISLFLAITAIHCAINPCDLRGTDSLYSSAIDNLPIPSKEDCICFTTLRNARASCQETSSYDQQLACWQGENSTVYSGHNIQDLGDYLQCSKYTENNYILVSLTNDNGSNIGFVGLCVPYQCQADNLYFVYEWYKLTNTTNTIFDYLNKGSPEFVQANTVPTEQGTPFLVCIIWAAVMVFAVIASTVILDRLDAKNKKDDDERANSGSVLRDAGSVLGADSTLSLLNPSMLSYNGSFMDDNSALRAPKKKKEGSNEIRKFLESFDLKRNYDDLMNDTTRDDQDENLTVFFGLRVLALFWVIYGNVALYSIKYSKNPLGANFFITDDWWFLVIYASQYAIGIFFFLSGFLGGFTGITKTKRLRPGLIGYFKFLFHRLVRIWPAYAFCLLFFWGIGQNLGSGPLWFEFVEASQQCNSNWWRNLVFIDNITFSSGDAYCFNWGWYLAADFQLFLIVPLICWAYDKSKENTKNLVWILIVTSIGISFYNAYLSGSYYAIPPLNLNVNGLQDFYYNPLVRASVYLIGVYFGICYKKHRTREEKNLYDSLDDNKGGAYLVHFAGWAVCLFVVFYPYTLQQNTSDWSQAFEYVWNVFGPILYILGLFLFIAPVLAGHLTLWKSILSCGFFVLIAKVSFLAYLLHYIVMLYDFNAVSSLTDFDMGNLVYKTLAVIFFSVVFASIIHLFVEKPFIELEKRFYSPKTKFTIEEDREALVQAKFSVQDVN